jgi:hypothetical protein
LGRRLWDDAISGLAVKYNKRELDGVDRLLRGGMHLYDKASLISRLDSLGHDYNDVALLDEAYRWAAVIEDLYRAGAVYTLEKGVVKRTLPFVATPCPVLPMISKSVFIKY